MSTIDKRTRIIFQELLGIKTKFTNISNIQNTLNSETYGLCSNIVIAKIINIATKKTIEEIKKDFNELERMKILQLIESDKDFKKYTLLDEKEKHLGIVYLGNSISTIYKIRKIRYNLEYLVPTWEINFQKTDTFILNLSSKDLEILLIGYDQSIRSIAPNEDIIKLREYERHFFIKSLSEKDIAMYCDKPIIINPEKVLLKDKETINFKQNLQFRNEDGNIRIIDKTSEEVEKKIGELETRQILNVMGNSDI